MTLTELEVSHIRAVLDEHQLARPRIRRRGGASGPQADDAREPDGQARHRAHETWWAARGRVVIDSGLFVGTLRHRRFTPVAHAFTYPLFMALLDVDRLPELMRVSRVTSYNRWNWASFDDRDHLGDPTRPLRDRLARRRDAPRDRPAGRPHLPADAPAVSRLRLQPRLLLLLLRCRGAAAGRPRGSEQHLWRDRTTTGCGRSPRPARSAPPPRSRSTSRRSCRSTWTTPSPSRHRPGTSSRTWRRSRRARSALTRRCRSNDGPGARRRSGARSSRYPAMTANVVAGIHWQALKLWWKGVPLVPRVTGDGVGERAAWDSGTVDQAGSLMER